MKFRWLGVAGIELRSGDEILLIDPYLTRAPLSRLWIGRVIPDREQLRKYLPACDHMLITHAHFDHVLDAADVLCYSNARGYGSPNACNLMAIMGAPNDRVQEITTGDHLQCGSFSVRAGEQAHPLTPIDFWINGNLQPNLYSPMRLLDYRMDVNLGYLIQVEGMRLSIGDLYLAADVLLTVPLKSKEYYRQLLKAVRPELVIPIHWDNLFLPLHRVSQEATRPAKITFPGVHLLLKHFKRQIESLSRDITSVPCRVMVPHIFQDYQLEKELHTEP